MNIINYLSKNKMHLCRKRSKKGLWSGKSKAFTLAELLVVVAIIGILTGISFVAVAQNQRNLRLTEMNNIAREIFVGAQNHLTQSKASGAWDKKILDSDETFDETFWGKHIEKPDDGVDAKTGEHDYRRIIVDAGTTDCVGGIDYTNVLGILLPLGAIDDTVRTGGYYSIEYDLLTAQVYAVFYTDQNTSPALASSDIDAIYAHGVGDADYRKTYSLGGRRVPVGYYGGAAVANSAAATTASTEEELQRVEAQIINGSRLLLVINDYNNDDTKYLKGISIILHDSPATGSTGGNEKTYDISKNTPDGAVTAIDGNGKQYRQYSYILDSVIAEKADALGSQSRHFGRFGFSYGCNVYAAVTLTEGVNKASADSNVENSLFKAAAGNTGAATISVGISNGRHLENLSSEISLPSGTDAKSANVSKASVKYNDIAWDTDAGTGTGAVSSFFTGLAAEEKTYGIVPTGSRNVLLSDGTTKAADNKFVGIASSTITQFSGGKHTITNIGIVSSKGNLSGENAGLFSSIGVQATAGVRTVAIDNLNLQNAAVEGEADAEGVGTGILCGSFNSNAATGTNKGASLSISEVNIINPIVKVSGKANASCMLGYVGNGSIYIKNSKLSTAGSDGKTAQISSVNGSAGGFVGALSGENISKVVLVNDVITGVTIDDKTSAVTGSFNAEVTGSGSIGGFIGNADCINADISISGSSLKPQAVSIKAKDGASGSVIGNCICKGFTADSTAINIEKLVIDSTNGNAGGAIGCLDTKAEQKLSNINMSASESATVTGLNYAGGIIGTDTSAGKINISVCTFNAGAEGKVSGSQYAGGLAGAVTGSAGMDISNCFASSYVAATNATADKEGAAGGFIGSADGNSSAINISECYSSGRTKDTLYSSTDENKANITAVSAMSVGGFAGIVKRAASESSVKNCYTTSSVYRAASSSTFGIGGFVGTVTSSVNMTGNYTTALVLQGDNAATGAGCFAGEGGTSITSDKNYYLNGVNTDINKASGDGTESVASKASAKDQNSPFYVAEAEQNNAKPFDKALSTKYPYKTVSQLTGDATKAKSHVGDWPTGTDTKTDFDKQFAIIYYEIVQHGDKTKGTDLGYYYHGYAADPQAINAGDSYKFNEVYTDITDGRKNNGKGLLTGHNEYVVESGYLVCIESDLDYSKIAVDSGWTQVTLESMIDNGTAKTNVLVPYDSIADKIGIEGYKIYRINENNTSVENYISNRKYTFDFTTSYSGYPGKNNWNNLTTFTLNPYFSDMLYPGTHDYGNVLGIRSAIQFSDQFNSGSKSYIGGWKDGTIEAVEQQMDISYSKDDVILTAYGEPLGDEAYVSPTLEQLRGTFRSANQSDVDQDHLDKNHVDKDYYVLKHVTKTLVSLNNAGTIKQLHITDLDVQDMSALVDNDQGNISDITIDIAKSPLFSSTNGGKNINDIQVKEFAIDRDCPYGLLINLSGNNTVIDNVKIDKITLGAVTIGNSNNAYGLIAGLTDSSILSNCTISNISDNSNTVYQGSYWGLVGNNLGKINNLKLSDCTFKGNASNVTEAFGIVGNNGRSGAGSGIGEFTADSNQTGTINNVSFSNLRTASGLDGKVGIIGINYHSFNNYKITNVKFESVGQSGASIIGYSAGGSVDSISVEGYTTDGNGFAATNSGSISNCSIVNAQIARNGFAGSSTNGTITGCHIYSDKSKYSANAYYAPNANTVDTNVADSDRLYGYNMVTIGLGINGNPYNNTADIPSASYAGFIGSATGTTISNCSVTGKVFGKSASGFFDSIGGRTQVRDCYANTITSAFDVGGAASGFGGSVNDSGTAVEYCHATGMLNNYGSEYNNSGKGICSGFISSAKGQNQWNTASVKYSYSAVWGENASAYYPFFKTADDSLTCSNCCYLDVFSEESNVNKDNESYAAAKTSEEISADTSLGTTTGIQTIKYSQYNNDSTDSSYPYPVNNTANIQYGDWKGTAAISLTVSDPAVLRVGKALSVTANVNPSGKGAGLVWTIGDASIATVNASGTACTITGVAAGSTTLTVRTADNVSYVKYTVIVAPAASKGVFIADKKNVTDIQFDVQRKKSKTVTAVLFDTVQEDAVQSKYTFASAAVGNATVLADTSAGASEYDSVNKIFRTNAIVKGIEVGTSAITIYKTVGNVLANTTANVIYPVFTIDAKPDEWDYLTGTDNTFNNVNINVKADQDNTNVYIMFLQKPVNNQGNLLASDFTMTIGNDSNRAKIKVICSNSSQKVTDAGGNAITGTKIAGTAAFNSQTPYYCEISIPESAINNISPTFIKATNWSNNEISICVVGN